MHIVFDVFLSKNNLGVQRYAFLSTYANLNMKLFIFQNYGTFIRMKVKGEKGKEEGAKKGCANRFDTPSSDLIIYAIRTSSLNRHHSGKFGYQTPVRSDEHKSDCKARRSCYA